MKKMSLRVRIECNRRTPRSFSPILRKCVFLCKRFSFEEESKVSRDDEWKRRYLEMTNGREYRSDRKRKASKNRGGRKKKTKKSS